MCSSSTSLFGSVINSGMSEDFPLGSVLLSSCSPLQSVSNREDNSSCITRNVRYSFICWYYHTHNRNKTVTCWHQNIYCFVGNVRKIHNREECTWIVLMLFLKQLCTWNSSMILSWQVASHIAHCRQRRCWMQEFRAVFPTNLRTVLQNTVGFVARELSPVIWRAARWKEHAAKNPSN